MYWIYILSDNCKLCILSLLVASKVVIQVTEESKHTVNILLSASSGSTCQPHTMYSKQCVLAISAVCKVYSLHSSEMEKTY